VLTAGGGITGNFGNITGVDDSEVLDISVVNTGSSLDLTVSRSSYAAFSGNAAGRKVGGALDEIVPLAQGSGDDMEDLLTSMDWDYSAGEIGGALEALSPEMYTAYATHAVTAVSLFSQSVSQHLAGMRRSHALGYEPNPQAAQLLVATAGANLADLGALAPHADSKRWSLWTRLTGTSASLKGDSEHRGTRQNHAGVAAGFDLRLASWLRGGFSAGYTNSDLEWGEIAYAGTLTGSHGALYAQAMDGGLFVNALFGYSLLYNQSQRSILFTGASSTARGQFDSHAWQGRLEAGRQFVSGNWMLAPVASLAYVWLHEQGFDESCADYLELGLSSREHESLASTLGVRAATSWSVGSMALRPRIGVFWLHEFMDDGPSVTAHYRDYSGVPFTVSGKALDSDRALIEAGLELKASARFAASLTYHMDLGQDYSAHSLAAGVKFRF
jgi:outer membrane autotransporter protein